MPAPIRAGGLGAILRRSWRLGLLGVLQGLTEFLPVSSSGHLALARQLLHLSDLGLSFDVGVHVGTLAAVVVAYRRDLVAMFWPRAAEGGSAPPSYGSRGLLGPVLLASVPLAVVGGVVAPLAERLSASLAAVAVAWCACGLLLVGVGRLPPGSRRAEDLRLRDLLWIGGLQVLALAPGFSRSGATIAGGLWRGLSGEQAARFAFLLSLPAVGGALLLQLPQWWRDGAGLASVVPAALAAAATGLLAIRWCRARTAAAGPAGFGYYCLALGGLCLARAALTGEWA